MSHDRWHPGVHQTDSYNSEGKSHGPNDYTSPNPIAFLTVAPGVRFLVALSGPPDLRRLAKDLLKEALQAFGVGAKTSLGYGRLKSDSAVLREMRQVLQPPVSAPPSPDDQVKGLREEIARMGKDKIKAHIPDWLSRIQRLDENAAVKSAPAEQAVKRALDAVTLWRTIPSRELTSLRAMVLPIE